MANRKLTLFIRQRRKFLPEKLGQQAGLAGVARHGKIFSFTEVKFYRVIFIHAAARFLQVDIQAQRGFLQGAHHIQLTHIPLIALVNQRIRIGFGNYHWHVRLVPGKRHIEHQSRQRQIASGHGKTVVSPIADIPGNGWHITRRTEASERLLL
ncbi:hypothetical protein D3C79_866340 [compost metagenome]